LPLLTYPTSIWRPVAGDPVGILQRSLATENPGLSYDIVCVILRLAILEQYQRVTDGWTDTRQQHIP